MHQTHDQCRVLCTPHTTSHRPVDLVLCHTCLIDSSQLEVGGIERLEVTDVLTDSEALRAPHAQQRLRAHIASGRALTRTHAAPRSQTDD
jgi:hypothetical protein